MANETGRNVQQFPPQSAGATLGPLVEIVHYDDASSSVTITPGDDGALPPGVSTSGATVEPVPQAPATQQFSPLADDVPLSFSVAAPKV